MKKIKLKKTGIITTKSKKNTITKRFAIKLKDTILSSLVLKAVN